MLRRIGTIAMDSVTYSMDDPTYYKDFPLLSKESPRWSNPGDQDYGKCPVRVKEKPRLVHLKARFLDGTERTWKIEP
jgi:hypothetical protein